MQINGQSNGMLVLAQLIRCNFAFVLFLPGFWFASGSASSPCSPHSANLLQARLSFWDTLNGTLSGRCHSISFPRTPRKFRTCLRFRIPLPRNPLPAHTPPLPALRPSPKVKKYLRFGICVSYVRGGSVCSIGPFQMRTRPKLLVVCLCVACWPRLETFLSTSSQSHIFSTYRIFHVSPFSTCAFIFASKLFPTFSAALTKTPFSSSRTYPRNSSKF